MNPNDEALWDEEQPEQPLVELTDPAGRVLRFRFVAALEYEGKPYVVLADLEPQSTEEDELVLLRVQPDPVGGADHYVMLDDPDEVQAVFGEYVSMTLREALEGIDEEFAEGELDGDCGVEGCHCDCDNGRQVLH